MIARNDNKIARYKGRPAEIIPPVYSNSGGIITYDGDYKIHTFNVSDNFIVYNAVDASALAVGGGSGVARAYYDIDISTYFNSGGGGGGHLVENYNLHIPAGIYKITVGIGGALGDYGKYGGSGSNSSIEGLLDASGAYVSTGEIDPCIGKGIISANGYNGGSYTFRILGGSTISRVISGGGGGDSEIGTDGRYYYDDGQYWVGGNGGAGTLSKINNEWYGGGGGGVGIAGGIDGSGLIGGGSHGDWWIDSNEPSGNSGVVIIRYKYK